MKAFWDDALTCTHCTTNETSLLCDACHEEKPGSAFDEDILKHAKARPSKRVCSACEANGLSPKDVNLYRCVGCKERGHQKFPSEALANAKRLDRNTALLCVDCHTKQQDIERILRKRESWRCTCKGPAKDRRHVYSNEKCMLYPTCSGEKRWPGKNMNVTQEQHQFLERVQKRRRT